MISARASAESPGPIAMNAERSCSGIKFIWVHTSIGVGTGRSAEAAIAGTRIHNKYAARAPTAIRIGLRNRATSINATLLASIVLTNTWKTSALTVNLLDQLLEVFNVLFAQFHLLAEIRHERCHSTSKQTINETMTLGRQPLVLRKYGRIEVTALSLRARRTPSFKSRFSRVLTVDSCHFW